MFATRYFRMHWTWKSNPLTVREQSISVLACIETVCACGLVLWIGVHLLYWKHFLFWIMIAPFLLLRSQESMDIGFSLVNRLNPNKYRWQEEMRGHHLAALTIIVKAFFILFTIRVASIVISVFRYGFKVVSNIPNNWFLYALQMDSFHPLEVLPGIELRTLNDPFDFFSRLRIGALYRRFLKKNECLVGWRKIVRTTVYIVVFISLFLPSFFFRWSVKATTIIYLPFIFLAKRISFRDDSIEQRVAAVAGERLKFHWALFGVVIGLTIVPITVATVAGYLAKIHELDPFLGDLTNYFTFVPRMERWNVARLFCAIITICMFVLSRICKGAFSRTPSFATSRRARLLDVVLRSLNMIRAAGVLYVVLCGIILAWGKAQYLDWILSMGWVMPEVGGDWFPAVKP